MNWYACRRNLCEWFDALWCPVLICAFVVGLIAVGLHYSIKTQNEQSLPAIPKAEAGHFFTVEDDFVVGGSNGEHAWVIRDNRTGRQYLIIRNCSVTEITKGNEL